MNNVMDFSLHVTLNDATRMDEKSMRLIERYNLAADLFEATTKIVEKSFVQSIKANEIGRLNGASKTAQTGDRLHGRIRIQVQPEIT